MIGTLPSCNEGCPKCGGEQLCPCENCADRNVGKVTWKWDETGEIISCGHCGFTAHGDEWMDFDMDRFLAKRSTDKPEGKV